MARLSHETRADLVDRFLSSQCKHIMATKGVDYAGGEASDEANANFDRCAERLGVSRYVIWGVYFTKHMLSIETWLRDGRVRSEPIAGRIADAVNYLLILYSMLIEDGHVEYPKQEARSA